MPQRTKYSPAEKILIVEAYLSGELSAGEIKYRRGIQYPALYKWVRLYKKGGATDLVPAVKIKKYSPEVKETAVMDYLNGVATQLEICTKLGGKSGILSLECIHRRKFFQVKAVEVFLCRPEHYGSVQY